MRDPKLGKIFNPDPRVVIKPLEIKEVIEISSVPILAENMRLRAVLKAARSKIQAASIALSIQSGKSTLKQKSEAFAVLNSSISEALEALNQTESGRKV